MKIKCETGGKNEGNKENKVSNDFKVSLVSMTPTVDYNKLRSSFGEKIRRRDKE